MASRPFARRHKDGQKQVDVKAPNMIDQFFASEPELAGPPDAGAAPVEETRPQEVRPGDTRADQGRPNLVAAPQVPDATPEVTLPDGAQAGWYPDSNKPGVMRYWDGFHLTGQVLHVHSRASDTAAADPPRGTGEAEGAPTVAESAADRPALSRSVGTPFGPPRVPVAGRGDNAAALPSPSASLPSDARAETAPAPTVPPATPQSPGRFPPRPLGDNGATGAMFQRPGVAGVEKGTGTNRPFVGAFDKRDTKAEPTPVEREAGKDKGELTDRPDKESAERPDKESAERPDKESAERPDKESAERPDKESAERPDKGDRTGKKDDKGHKADRQESAPQNVLSFGSPKAEQKGAQGEEDVRNWAAMTETAVARARAVSTPEAWEQAAQAALVVSEMAQAMQAVAEAAQLAHQRSRAAEEAEHEARVATQADAEAKEEARRTSKAAEKAAGVARAAVEEAAAAEQRAKKLDDIVSRARKTNTPEAWREAHKMAASATDSR